MSDTLVLATRLRAMDNSEISEAIRKRSISPSGIKDFFDLAEAFLDRGSIQNILTRLDRASLAALCAIGELSEESGPPSHAKLAARLSLASDRANSATVIADRAIADQVIADRVIAAKKLLLLDSESGPITVYASVRDQLRSWPALGLPSFDDLTAASAPADLETVPYIDRSFIDRLGAERAFLAVTAVTELLGELEREPARELAKGGIALPDSKRLAQSMVIDLELVAVFVALAERAGLVARETGYWRSTEGGGSWLLRSTAARWATLSGSWFEHLPADIGALLGDQVQALWGPSLRGVIDWHYPAGGDWMQERISTYTRDAELLGITANQAPTSPGSRLLSDGIRAAETAMTSLLPSEVEQVYLQNDLSVVAPGPLTPRVDVRLRSLADVESRALASSYRVSTASVNRAMAAGESAQSLLEFLSGISLTGIPQPLEYLITEASSRFGQVRVGGVTESGSDIHSYLRSEDELLIGTILVDQNLSSLGFQRTSATRAESRFPLDVIFWSVSDARYPVAAEDAAGNLMSLRRKSHSSAAAPAGLDPVDALIERLRIGGELEEETGQAWLIRQLDAAIKSKTPLTVSVTMPNGSLVDYQLELTSVSGGRLRGRDNRAAIERTLPLSRIAGISPAK